MSSRIFFGPPPGSPQEAMDKFLRGEPDPKYDIETNLEGFKLALARKPDVLVKTGKIYLTKVGAFVRLCSSLDPGPTTEMIDQYILSRWPLKEGKLGSSAGQFKAGWKLYMEYMAELGLPCAGFTGWDNAIGRPVEVYTTPILNHPRTWQISAILEYCDCDPTIYEHLTFAMLPKYSKDLNENQKLVRLAASHLVTWGYPDRKPRPTDFVVPLEPRSVFSMKMDMAGRIARSPGEMYDFDGLRQGQYLIRNREKDPYTGKDPNKGDPQYCPHFPSNIPGKYIRDRVFRWSEVPFPDPQSIPEGELEHLLNLDGYTPRKVKMELSSDSKATQARARVEKIEEKRRAEMIGNATDLVGLADNHRPTRNADGTWKALEPEDKEDRKQARKDAEKANLKLLSQDKTSSAVATLEKSPPSPTVTKDLDPTWPAGTAVVLVLPKPVSIKKLKAKGYQLLTDFLKQQETEDEILEIEDDQRTEDGQEIEEQETEEKEESVSLPPVPAINPVSKLPYVPFKVIPAPLTEEELNMQPPKEMTPEEIAAEEEYWNKRHKAAEDGHEMEKALDNIQMEDEVLQREIAEGITVIENCEECGRRIPAEYVVYGDTVCKRCVFGDITPEDWECEKARLQKIEDDAKAEEKEMLRRGEEWLKQAEEKKKMKEEKEKEETEGKKEEISSVSVSSSIQSDCEPAFEIEVEIPPPTPEELALAEEAVSMSYQDPETEDN